jgi:hypothetical protein
MTTGTVKTQGTRLFFAVSDSEILKVACPTGITGLGGPGGQIGTTCLDSEEMEYERGMLDPGPLTVPINFIPRSAAHQALIDLRESGEKISWMIVFSDRTGAGPTTLDSNGRLVSPGPTTAEFLAYVSDFAFDIATNEIVRGTLTLQRSGAAEWNFPGADLA